MNSKETTQIITLLAGNYPSISQKTLEQKQMMINTWQECLQDLDYQLVLNAVKKSIMQNPYPPTIYDIRKNVVEFTNPTQDNALQEWDECYKMICNGTYMTQEEFNSHSEICKKFLGSLSQLKAYATNEDFNMDVVRSNFLKQYEILKAREKEEKLIPIQMQEMIKNITNNEFKRIGDK